MLSPLTSSLYLCNQSHLWHCFYSCCDSLTPFTVFSRERDGKLKQTKKHLKSSCFFSQPPFCPLGSQHALGSVPLSACVGGVSLLICSYPQPLHPCSYHRIFFYFYSCEQQPDQKWSYLAFLPVNPNKTRCVQERGQPVGAGAGQIQPGE